jgi:hypothetical protein
MRLRRMSECFLSVTGEDRSPASACFVGVFNSPDNTSIRHEDTSHFSLELTPDAEPVFFRSARNAFQIHLSERQTSYEETSFQKNSR